MLVLGEYNLNMLRYGTARLIPPVSTDQPLYLAHKICVTRITSKRHSVAQIKHRLWMASELPSARLLKPHPLGGKSIRFES